MYYRAAFSVLLFAIGVSNVLSDSLPDGEKIPPSSPKFVPEHQLLEKARAANGDLYSSLKSFVCREEIQRFRGILGPKAKAHVIDSVSASLSFENGIERYYNVRQNSQTRPSLSALAGAWSEGEFGTLLQQTGKLLETQQVSFIAFATLGTTATAIYRFSVSEDESPWDLAVGPQHYRIPFTTDVWISVASGEILKISRKSLSISAETRISEIAWDVTLAAVDLNGRTWLLPAAAAYSVSYFEAGRREWNEMSFSGYQRYGSESSLRFDGVQ